MKKIFAFFVLTSCVGLLHAQDSSNQGQPQQGQPPQRGGYQGGGTSYSSGSVQYSSHDQPSSQNGVQGLMGGITDQALTSQIQNWLSSGQYQGKYNNVTATINSGNVTLQGTVNSQEEKDALGALVGGVNGVKSVTNQVTVQGSSQGNSGSQSNSSQSNSGSYQGTPPKNH